MIGILHFEDETFITDRNNEARTPLHDVEVHPTWDIDRAGSKGQVDVFAHRGGLEANMWIATYRTITPERGEIVRWPRGHWRLSTPGVVYDGAHEMDTGVPSQPQTARGSDIIDDIAEAGVPFTFYTPVNGMVMLDVHHAIRMATAGIIGPNLMGNNGFEAGAASWTIWNSGITTPQPGFDWTGAAEGARVLRLTTPANAPNGAEGGVYQNASIPPGIEYLMLSAMAYTGHTRAQTAFRIEWRDASGELSRTQDYIANRAWWGAWQRLMTFVPVPAGATIARVTVGFKIVSGGGSGYPGDIAYVDDVQLRAVSHMPLPDDRINLPPHYGLASTRIQTTQDKSIGYDAINADRLSAIGHYALSTGMDGRLTTMPIRNIETTQPKYTFGPNDIAILDMPVEIPARSGAHHNHFRAIKEDFENGANAMVAHSYNRNVNDPYSVPRVGKVVSAPTIHVQDAVDQEALQAVADGARDRYSVQEEIRFAVMPLSDLTVYDVVRIVDADMPQANGVWAVESIDDTPDGYMMIGARRATGGGS